VRGLRAALACHVVFMLDVAVWFELVGGNSAQTDEDVVCLTMNTSSEEINAMDGHKTNW